MNLWEDFRRSVSICGSGEESVVNIDCQQETNFAANVKKFIIMTKQMHHEYKKVQSFMLSMVLWAELCLPFPPP